MLRPFLAALLCVANASAIAEARDAAILIVGTCHFSNPHGLDVRGMRVTSRSVRGYCR